MLKPADHWFADHAEPDKSCLQFLRGYVLQKDAGITETWKYGMPVYCYQGKMFCYLWWHKKYRQPYLGIVRADQLDHPGLLQEKRAKMKILLFNPSEDIPLQQLDILFEKMLVLYR